MAWSLEIIFIWLLTIFTLYVGIFWMGLALAHRPALARAPKARIFPKLSILIPAFNEEDTLAASIDSLQKLSYPSKAEIIVVNNGSTDGTLKVASDYAKKGLIKLVNLGRPNKGAALNAGLKAAKGELIAVMDADSIVRPDAANKLVGYFEDPKVAAVVASIKPIQNKKRTFIERMQHAEYIISNLYRKLGSLTDMIYVTPGAFSLFRSKALREVGGFAEKNLTEDLEIALRLRSNGWYIRNSMSAVAYTALPENLRQLYSQRIRWYRGLVKNTFGYKKMLFNRKFGWLGLWQLPMNIIFPIISLSIIALFFATNAVSLFQLYRELTIVGFQLPQFSLERMALGFDWRMMLPWIAGLGFGIYAVRLSYKASGESIRKGMGKLTSLAFLMFYYTIINVLWTIAILKEVRGSKTKW
jgi:cellulose synthase/poly-beta-1,6-N-acetylglucosamine synthase-like glycosyltransferase